VCCGHFFGVAHGPERGVQGVVGHASPLLTFSGKHEPCVTGMQEQLFKDLHRLFGQRHEVQLPVFLFGLGLVRVNYPGRPATTILAGGGGRCLDEPAAK